MDVKILGSGPSLSLFDFIKDTKNCKILYCNSLIYKNKFREIDNATYVAHDKRLYCPEFVEKIKSISHKVIIEGDLKQIFIQNKISLKNKTVIRNKKFLGNHLFQKMENIPDLERNVVLDLALPTALGLGAKNIELFGCDFDYFLSGNNKPGYAVKNKGRFDHTYESAQIWAKRSSIFFQKITDFFSNHNISIHKK